MAVFVSEKTVAVGTTSGTFLPACGARIGLILSSPKTNRVTISVNNPVIAANGLALQPGTVALKLCEDDVGEWLRGELHAIAETAGETIGVLEVLQI